MVLQFSIVFIIIVTVILAVLGIEFRASHLLGALPFWVIPPAWLYVFKTCLCSTPSTLEAEARLCSLGYIVWLNSLPKTKKQPKKPVFVKIRFHSYLVKICSLHTVLFCWSGRLEICNMSNICFSFGILWMY
jgi:hypothetical protein